MVLFHIGKYICEKFTFRYFASKYEQIVVQTELFNVDKATGL